MEPIVDHIQITVKDWERAVAFYDAVLPILGFDPGTRSTAHLEEFEFHVMEYSHPKLTFGINSPRPAVAGDDVHRRRPGSLHHLAFRAESRAEVDRVHVELVRVGAEIVHAPQVFPQHVPHPYYACFFKDPGGIKYEVVCAGQGAE